jgi:cobalt-zinc-cadmium efflux system protein
MTESIHDHGGHGQNSAGNDHGNGHNHNHNHDHDVSGLGKGKLLLVIFFNLAISAAEVVGGLISGSLSLVSDAVHNLSDSVSIIFSYIAVRISEKPKSKTKTYGYNRANILAAFVNAAALIGISVFLMVEAVQRFLNPPEITGDLVIIVAAVGLLGNLFSVLVLRKSSQENMNIKSSYLHLMSDTLSSVAVIAGGILIKFIHINWVDPVLTLLINLVILRSAFFVLKESVNILMQGTPLGADADAIASKLMDIGGVRGAHHIHVWRLDEKNTILEAHVLLDDMPVSQTAPLNAAISELLEHEFGVNHSVIQFESDPCDGESCRI